jgi:hypothetical protein
MEHLVLDASEEEKKHDCCGDRYLCNVTHVCSCGMKACRSCIESHLLQLHWDTEGQKKRDKENFERQARAKLAAITPEERKLLGI